MNNIAPPWVSSIRHVNKPFSEKLLLCAVENIIDIKLSAENI